MSMATGRQFNLNPEQYMEMLDIINRELKKEDLLLCQTARYRVCFRPGMAADNASILLDDGREFDLTKFGDD